MCRPGNPPGILSACLSAPQASGAASAAPGSGGIGAPPGVLLPTAKQRAALFQADPDLKQLHQSLVEAGILGEAEFWGARQELVRGGGGGGARLRQRAGLPSTMLADVKPSADGQTEKVHFQLTPQIIQQARHCLRQGLWVESLAVVRV